MRVLVSDYGVNCGSPAQAVSRLLGIISICAAKMLKLMVPTRNLMGANLTTSSPLLQRDRGICVKLRKLGS